MLKKGKGKGAVQRTKSQTSPILKKIFSGIAVAKCPIRIDFCVNVFCKFRRRYCKYLIRLCQ